MQRYNFFFRQKNFFRHNNIRTSFRQKNSSSVLERVADGEVQGVGILEAVDVEVARLPCVVR